MVSAAASSEADKAGDPGWRFIARWAIAAQAVAAIAIGLYVVVRAARLSLTYDEAAGYIRYIAPHAFPDFDNGPLAPFNFEVATNHLLSTILTKVLVLLWGPGELVLRTPAIAGYLLYVWFSASLLRRLTHTVFAAAGFLLVVLNPYVLDFFSLARGYGLATGLMMGAIDALSRGDAQRTLLFASGAALANFSLLNLYAAVALVLLAQRMLKAQPLKYGWRVHGIAYAIAATAFSAAVFSQDPGLTPTLYEPISLRLDAAGAEQLQGATIWRIDLHGRITPFSDARVPFRAVRVDVPGAVAERLARIEVRVGSLAFASDPRRSGWSTIDVEGTRQFESTDMIATPRSKTREFHRVMNWAGDRTYVIAVLRATALALLALGALAGLLWAAGPFVIRAGFASQDGWRILSISVLWLAALGGPPMYLLQRGAQLYFGGTRGLIDDTFYSLIESSFYGASYVAGQTKAAFLGIVLTVAAFMALLPILVKRSRVRLAAPAGLVLAVILLACASMVTQHVLFGTVYLMGRTALFFIPLYLLFLVLLCQMLTSLGPVWRVIGTLLLTMCVVVSTLHFMHTANLQSVLDWRDDASTKAMMTDLEGVVGRSVPGRKTVLAVEWIYAPAAAYYARRHEPIDIDVVIPPSPRPSDFLYIDRRHMNAGKVVSTYRIAGTVLMQAR